jgi:hypothetical protein
MKTVSLNTNLHCSNCLTKLKPVLDGNTKIAEWSVNLSVPGKTLTAQTSLTAAALARLVEHAGFIASRQDAGPAAVCDMPQRQTSNARAFSWKDVAVWRRAGFNTLNCLIGCSIGDLLMVIFLQARYPFIPMGVQMLLATVAGLVTSVLLETVILHHREKMNWKPALTMAMSMSFISMVAMELAMNATDFMITGGGKMPMTSAGYWLAFLPAALAGFLFPLPYNYYKLKKHGKACH